MTPFDFISSGLRTIDIESVAIASLKTRLDARFVKACDTILACEGRTIVTGMGKSGHIGRKIAATLASTGSPAFFVHPGEASHGDLGMITEKDVVLAISYSGNSNEIVTLLPLLKRSGIKIIAMTANPRSPLGEAAETILDIAVEREACPLALAPTASTTATLAFGDALAIALLEARGFTAEDFAFSHPGGALGKKLLLRVSDIMNVGSAIPKVPPETPLVNALMVMSEKGFGMTTVMSAENELLGIYTDGDLRRNIDQRIDIHRVHVGEVMNKKPITISANAMAAEALKVMEQTKINVLLAIDERSQLVGVIKINDILRTGII